MRSSVRQPLDADPESRSGQLCWPLLFSSCFCFVLHPTTSARAYCLSPYAIAGQLLCTAAEHTSLVSQPGLIENLLDLPQLCSASAPFLDAEARRAGRARARAPRRACRRSAAPPCLVYRIHSVALGREPVTVV